MATTPTEFVTGWNIVQTLGEGAFGEVKLLINQDDGEAVAAKIIDLERHADAAEAVRKEVVIHRMMKHKNIISFYGSRREGVMQYMFLEYAAGGELFDRIEPDAGMPLVDAQNYFHQLINGVEFLHSKGVAHRDIKPENLLLDGNDILKITDFGMATLFRFKGEDRELDRKCGTKPYMAPEILVKPYSGEPIDIWSCGVVLVALLAGELPWDEPTFSCHEFLMWKDKDCKLLNCSPWVKIDTLALALLRKILNTVPRHRATIASIRSNQWMKKKFSAGDMPNPGVENFPRHANKKVCSEVDFGHHNIGVEDVATRHVCSQPQAPSAAPDESLNQNIGNVNAGIISFSQPANMEQLLVSQLTQGTQASQTPLQRLVKRMTRVLVSTSLENTMTYLQDLFTKMNYSHRCLTVNVITVTTVDRRGAPLILKATVLDMGPYILVDFRLSKGCGLDFKRQFLRIKDQLSGIIVKGPVSWHMALAYNMLPA